jgi:hypothetical protein
MMVLHSVKAILHGLILRRKAILHGLILRRIANKVVHTRSLIILSTVAVSYVLQWALFVDINNDGGGDLVNTISSLFASQNSTYYTNYCVGFIKSFVVLLLCNAAVNITSSYRLIGLMFFVLISMLLDLGSVLSVSFYDYMLEVRYNGDVNFKDIFTCFEVICVVYTVIDWIINIVRRKHSTLSAVDNHGRFAVYFCKSRTRH